MFSLSFPGILWVWQGQKILRKFGGFSLVKTKHPRKGRTGLVPIGRLRYVGVVRFLGRIFGPKKAQGLVHQKWGFDGTHDGSHQAWAKINASFCNGLMGPHLCHGSSINAMGVGSYAMGRHMGGVLRSWVSPMCLDAQIAKSQSRRFQIAVQSQRFEITERSAKSQTHRL